MEQFEAIVIQRGDYKMAVFDFMGGAVELEIINPQGLKHRDTILVKYNGRDHFVTAV